MSVKTPLLFLLAIPLAASCASSEPAGYRLQSTSANADEAIPIFQGTLPSEAYAEVGEIYARPNALNTSADRSATIASMRDEAQAAGCHGLILPPSFGAPDATQPPAYPPQRELQRGVCIVFRDGPAVAAKYRGGMGLTPTPCSMSLDCQRQTERRIANMRPVRPIAH